MDFQKKRETYFIGFYYVLLHNDKKLMVIMSKILSTDVQLKRLHHKRNLILNENAIIHSNQGAHYASPKFHHLIKKDDFGIISKSSILIYRLISRFFIRSFMKGSFYFI